MKVVNLNALAVTRHVVEYDGAKHNVRTMTALIANVIDAAAAETDGAKRLAGYHEAIGLILPTMNPKIITGLEAPMMMQIIELSKDQINVIEAAVADPNADRPASTPKKGTRRARTSLGAS
jgi:hypothetical protein